MMTVTVVVVFDYLQTNKHVLERTYSVYITNWYLRFL